MKGYINLLNEEFSGIDVTLSHIENNSNSIANTNSELHLLVKGNINLLNEELSGINATISRLKNNSESIFNITNNVQLVVNEIIDLQSEELPGIGATLSHLNKSSLQIFSTTNDILFSTLKLQNTTAAIPASCKEVNKSTPTSPSGYYHIQGHDVYCHMEKLCESEGPWTRVALLNMYDATVNCPSEFKLYQEGSTRACGRQTSSTESCQSVKYYTNGISYSEVCGRVIGFQKGTPDAIQKTSGYDPHYANINSFYVDGISITRGFSTSTYMDPNVRIQR